MIGQQQRAVIAGPPPLCTSPNFQGDIHIGEFEAGLTQIDVLVVQRGQWADCRSMTERVPVADELGLDLESCPISHFEPSADIRLILNTIGIIFTSAIFAETDRLSLPD